MSFICDDDHPLTVGVVVILATIAAYVLLVGLK